MPRRKLSRRTTFVMASLLKSREPEPWERLSTRTEDLWRNLVGSIRALSYLDDRNLEVPATRTYKWWNRQVIQTCKLLSTHPFKPFPRRFSGSESTACSSKPQRPSDSSRSWLRILLSGDVQSIHVRCVLAMSRVVG